MRVILETQKKAAVQTSPQGRRVQGTAWFTVLAFDRDESVPEIYDYAQPVAGWLNSIGPSRPFRVAPPKRLSGRLVEAVIPRAILESLPAESVVAMQWEFVPGGRP